MLTLIVIGVVLLLVMLIGHGLWMLASLFFRVLLGNPHPPKEDLFRRDLAGFQRVLGRLWERGDIATGDRAELQLQANALLSPVAQPIAPQAATAARTSAAERANVDPNWLGEEEPPVIAQLAPSGAQPPAFAPGYEGGVHPLDQSVPALSSEGITRADPHASAAPLARKATAEVLKSFLAAHNIRWGELIAGLLIVVCSIGLVISLWSSLTETHRLLPAFVFLAGTAAIEAAGLYTLRRWRLRHTSRAVLTIATLLIPLSVVAGIAVAVSGTEPIHLEDPFTLGFVAVGTALYGGAIWLAGVAMVRRHDAQWWLVAVACPTLLLPLVPTLTHHWQSSSGWTFVAVASLVSLAILMPAGRRKPRGNQPMIRPVAGRHQLLIAGLGLHALLVLAGFFAFFLSKASAAVIPLAVSLVPIIVTLHGLGSSFRRSQTQWQRLTGIILMGLTASVLAGSLPLTAATPGWLIGWCGLTVIASIAVAARLRLESLLGLALLAVGIAGVSILPWWWSDGEWLGAPGVIAGLITSPAMLFGFGYGLFLVLVGTIVEYRQKTSALGSPRWSQSSYWIVTLTGAGWLSYAVAIALLSGCFGWVKWFALQSLEPAAWQAAVLVIASTAGLCLFAASDLKRRRFFSEPRLRPWRFSLLRGGQAGLWLAAGIVLGWSIPDRLFGLQAFSHGNAGWWWLGWAAACALAWQILRWKAPHWFPGRLAVHPTRITVDVLAGLLASNAMILCSGLAVARLMILYGSEQRLVFGAPWVPMVAIALTLGWLATVRTRNHVLQTLLIDQRVLGVQAAFTWFALCGFAARPLALAWIGSIALLVMLIGLSTAWWLARRLAAERHPGERRIEFVAGLATRSAGWGGVIVALMSASTLQHHLVPAFFTTASIDITRVIPVVVWLGICSLTLAIASIVTARPILASLAGAVAPLAALIAALTISNSPWVWFETIGWTGFVIVGGQRLLQQRRVVAWLESLAITPRTASLHNAWPLPIRGLLYLGLVIAGLFALINVGLLWLAPSGKLLLAASGTANLATPSTIAFVATAMLMWFWQASFQKKPGFEIFVQRLSDLLLVLAGPIFILAIREAWLLPSQGRVSFLAVLMVSTWIDTLLAMRNPAGDQHWALGMAKGCGLVLLGCFPTILSSNAVWFGVAGCLAVQALGMIDGHVLVSSWLTGHLPSGNQQTRYWFSQIVWSVTTLIGCVMVASVAWQTTGEPLLATILVMGWLATVTTYSRIGQPRLHPAYLCLAESIAVGLTLLAMLQLIYLDVSRDDGSSTPWLVGGAMLTTAVVLAMTTGLRMGRNLHVVAGVTGVLLATVALTLQLSTIAGGLPRAATATVAVAVMTTLLTWLWPLRRSLRAALRSLELDWSRTEDASATKEFSAVVIAVTCGTLILATHAAFFAALPLNRHLTVAAVMLCGWAMAVVANRLDQFWLRTAAVLLFASGVMLTAIAAPGGGMLAGSDQRALISTMQLLVAGCCLVPTFGWIVPRIFRTSTEPWRGTEPWRRPLRIGAGVGGCLATLALFAMLALEAKGYSNGTIGTLDRTVVGGIAILLASVCAATTWLAVRAPQGLPTSLMPALVDDQRAGLIYAAQGLGLVTWLHLFLCNSYWAHLGLRAYWPYVVVVLALASVGVVEWAKRRGDSLLAEKLRQTAILLPLIPAIGFWHSGAHQGWQFTGGSAQYAVLLAIVGMFYIGLAFVWRSDRWPRVLGLIAGNAAIWVWLLQSPGWAFLQHPQLWLIPPAVCLLVALHLERERLKPEWMATMRYGAMLVIYISSTADMLLQEIGQTLWGPIILVSLALLGVMLGAVLQIRSFLYLGTLFVLLGVLSMVWHAQQAIDQIWPWWAFGITSGVLILAGLMMLEKQKPQIRRLSQRLASWEG